MYLQAFSFIADALFPERRSFFGVLANDLAPDPALAGVFDRPVIVARVDLNRVTRWLNVVQINPELVHAVFLMDDGRCIVEVEAVVMDFVRHIPNVCIDDLSPAAHTIIDYILINIPMSRDGSNFVAMAVYPDTVFPTDRQVAMDLCPSLRHLYDIPGAQVHAPAVEAAWELIACQFPQMTVGPDECFVNLDGAHSVISMFGSMSL